MTHQAYPPTDAQQLADARKATEVAQALANDHAATVDRQRKEIERAQRWARRWKRTAYKHRAASRDWEYHHDDLKAGLDDANQVLDAAGVPRAVWTLCNNPACQTKVGHRVRALTAERDELTTDLKHCADHHQQALEAHDTLSHQLADLTQLVGAETPIAAFTLSETWQAEKAAYQEQIAELRGALGTLMRHGNYQGDAECLLVSRATFERARAALAGAVGEGGKT